MIVVRKEFSKKDYKELSWLESKLLKRNRNKIAKNIKNFRSSADEFSGFLKEQGLSKEQLNKFRSNQSGVNSEMLVDAKNVAKNKALKLAKKIKKVGKVGGGLALAGGLALGGNKIYESYKDSKDNEIN